MIRIANITDLTTLAVMMQRLYKELTPDHASEDNLAYRMEVCKHLNNPLDTVYIADDKGFFIVRDETEALAPTLRRYNGIRVYIEPEHRRTRLLANFYKRLFEDYPDGDILGVTEINSEHIAVLDKRHTLIAKVYKLKRR